MRIVLLLDSFNRDINLNLKLASILSKETDSNQKPLEIFIAQTGSDTSRVALSAPQSIIVHNVIREKNSWQTKKFKELGSVNYNLDTEGCPLWMFNHIGMGSNIDIKNTDGYFAWGEWQDNEVKKLSTNIKVIKCGSFRHQIIEKLPLAPEGNCLILTSSSITNPLYCDKKEAWNLWRNGCKGLTDEEAFLVVEEQAKNTKKICALLPELSDYFKNVVIRLHPCESLELYKKEAKKFKNISFSSEYSLFQDLRKSSIVINSYSNAGVEVALSGKKLYSLERTKNLPSWLNKYLDLVSLNSEELKVGMVKQILSKDQENMIEINNEQKKLISKYYGTDITSEEGLLKIKNELIERISNMRISLNITLIKRYLQVTGLHLRKLLNKAPSPKPLKLISDNQIRKVITDERIDLKLIEIGKNSGIWKVSK